MDASSIRTAGTRLRCARTLMAVVASQTIGHAAPAATFFVNTTADTQDANPGDCLAQDANGNTSLRAAIMEANAASLLCPGPHTIVLPTGFFTTTLLGAGEDNALTGDLDIRTSLIIQGQGAASTIIDGSACAFPPCLGGDRVFHILDGEVAIKDLRIVRGYAPPGEDGGGILHAGTAGGLSLMNIELADNHASHGGGVFISGSGPGARMLGNVSISDCSAFNDGGAVLLKSGSLGLLGCTVRDNGANNDGGGLYIGDGTTLNAQLTQIFANHADKRGGGAFIQGIVGTPGTVANFIDSVFEENTAALAGAIQTGGDTSFDNCQIIGNSAIGPPLGAIPGTAGGGIYHIGHHTKVHNSTVRSNVADSGNPDDTGGGMFVEPWGSVDVTRSTFSSNRAGNATGLGQGGGIGSVGHLAMVNCTISGNLAHRRGGGLFNADIGHAYLSHVTIAMNHADMQGGGIYRFNSPATNAPIEMKSTLIALNTITNPLPPFNDIPQNYNGLLPAPWTFEDYCLDDDGTCGLSGPGSISSVPAGITGLGVFAPGLTEVHGLAASSLAVDAADPTCTDLAGNIVTIDQRGIARPQDGNADGVFRCDIGAFELEPISVCGVPLPAGATFESEPCGSDTNGGCNSTPDVYASISCNTTVCGDAWLAAGTRDTDWYTLNVTDLNGDGQSLITATLLSEFDGTVIILNDDCTNIIIYAIANSTACTPMSVSATVASPGTYRVFAAPSFAASPTCGNNNKYLLAVNVDDCPPAMANDNCSAAQSIGAGTFAFTNSGATTDGPAEPCGFIGAQNQDHDIWYSYTAPCTGYTTITLQSVAFDGLIAVYAGGCPQAGYGQVACAATPAGGGSATVAFQSCASNVYVIRIGGAGGSQGAGQFDITYTCTCPADISGPGGVPDCKVNSSDLIAIINNWGPCPPPCPPYCFADINQDCVRNAADMLMVINSWGPCP